MKMNILKNKKISIDENLKQSGTYIFEKGMCLNSLIPIKLA